MFYNDGKLYTEREIKDLYPNVSFPKPFKAPSGFETVFETPKPEVSSFQVSYKDGTELDSKGNRVVKWAVKDMFDDYTDQDGNLKSKKDQETEYFSKLLNQAKELKYNEIRNAYKSDINNTIEKDIDNIKISWQGGFDSALKLDGAMRLAETAGLDEVTFYDIENVGHKLSLSAAKDVVIAVSNDFQSKLAKKQSLMCEVKAAVTIEEV